MFGWFRFCAALLVVVGHIGGIEFVAGVAVRGFFLLSGFLMAAIITDRYGTAPAGLVRFALSRAWRLYPTYWASCLLTAAIIAAGASALEPRWINSALAFPTAVRDIFAGVFIVGHTWFGIGRVDSALSPSAWAVDVEILMYACSALFLAHSARLARWTTLLLVVLVPVLWLIARQLVAAGEVVLAGQLLYSFLPSALLPYALGTLMWFHRERLGTLLRRRWLLPAGLGGLLCCHGIVFPHSVTAAGLLSLPCLLAIVGYLSTRRASDRVWHVDDFLGRMAYPIYLLHWTGAYLVALLFDGDGRFYTIEAARVHFTLPGFFLVTAAIVLMAGLFARFVEGPIEQARRRWISAHVEQHNALAATQRSR